MDKDTVLLCVIILAFFFLASTTKKNPPKAAGDPATVIKCEGKCSQGKDGVTVTCPECFVTFQLDSKKEVRLKVPEGAYCFIKVGDKGRLYYTGDKFQNFDRK